MHVTAVTALVRASAGHSSGRFAVLIEDGFPCLPTRNLGSLDQRKRPARTIPKSASAFKAYETYERRGRVDGFALDDWLQAEAEVVGTTKKPKAKVAKRSK
jgi:hypothetical protein